MTISSLTARGLIQKIKYFLITNFGKIASEASPEEFYYAFCLALREEIMIHWTASLKTFEKTKPRILYYLSMEYLPGKFLSNNITNIAATQLVEEVLKLTDIEVHELLATDRDPGLGNGGLGRLASCFLDSLATQHYPAFGYGLRYQYGIFDQEIWNGVQIERPDCWLLNENPWGMRKDIYAQSVHYSGMPISAVNSHGDEVFQLEDPEEVRALPFDYPIVGYSRNLPFSVLTLRLWTTKESPHNFKLQRYNAGQLEQAAENTTLTDVLYPNDNNEVGKRIRLKQEFLLVSASLQDILKQHFHLHQDITTLPEKVQIQINDTHPALVFAELTRRLNKNYDISFDQAWDITKACCNYTNHTILKESLEEWNEHRVEQLLPRQYYIIQKLNERFCKEAGEHFGLHKEQIQKMSFIEDGQIKMAHLAIYGAKKVNGVAYLHTEILKHQLFKDFFALYPEKFVHITNGVTQRRFLLSCNPLLSSFITELIGDQWIEDFSHIEHLREFADKQEVQERFLDIKKNNKKNLIHYLSTQNPIRDPKGKIIRHSSVLDTDALFDAHIKRFHEYKRQLMLALHTLILFNELKENPSSRKIKRMIIIGGKAAPGYEIAKKILRLLFCIGRTIENHPQVRSFLRLVIVENYNVSRAELIIPATDISEQISTAGMEASGTGNMKLSMNGALTVGTEDGANIEMRQAITDQWWPFSFGLRAEEIAQKKAEKSYHPSDIYSSHSQIQKALDMLQDGSLTTSDEEHSDFLALFEELLKRPSPEMADRYFVLEDLISYYEIQKKVEDLFAQPYKWAEYAIHNIAGMGRFSSDEVINNYSKSIWNLTRCPIDPEILTQVTQEYSEYNRFRSCSQFI